MNQRDILENQIVIDAQLGDTTVLADLLARLSDAVIYGAMSDENQAKVVDPTLATKVPEFKELGLRGTEVIAVEEDGRTLGTSRTEKGVFNVIEEHYCDAKIKMISTEWRKHNMELVLTVEVTDEDGDVNERDFELRTTLGY